MKDRNKQYHYTELLAPAGSLEAFYGAVNAGADAVYLAGNRFGARAYAENFSTEKLVECIRYAHLLGRKIYLTVNTLFKEAELAELYDYLLPFYEAGLDAVIVQDIGVFRYIREHFPGLELHVSTQMTVCNGYDAALLKEMGASRVVPARELSLQELILMKQKADVEIEAFIHGAMCYCYSGQCLFSSILGGRSGNRGRCAQPCRLPYTVKAGNVIKENCYPLSLKDMCTIEHVPQLIEAGIDSFKIEGRMKKPEYAAGVTDIYRRAMDSYYEMREKKGIEEATACYKVPQNDMRALRTLYIRSDIQDGYYFKHNGAEMVTMTNPAYSGSDEELLQRINQNFLTSTTKLPISIMAVFQVGQPANVTFMCGETVVQVFGEDVSVAQKQPISEENVRKQLNKLGDTAFYAENMDITLSENAFYPLKQINELRRVAVEKLERALLTDSMPNTERDSVYKFEKHSLAGEAFYQATDNVRIIGSESSALHGECVGKNQLQKNGYVVSVTHMAQLDVFAKWYGENKERLFGKNTISRIYVDGDILLDEWDKASRLCKEMSKELEIWIMLPYILRTAGEKHVKSLLRLCKESEWLSGFVARSMGKIGLLREEVQDTCRIRGDVGLYTWNHSAMKELSSMVEGFCLPYELTAKEHRELLGKYACEKIIYGRIPMMITANCLMRTADKCKKNSADETILTDRYHTNFKVIRNCRYCYNIIYNSVPLSLHNKVDEWNKEGVDLRLDFSAEDGEEMVQILETILFGGEFPIKNYTTGHEKRGVE